MKTFTKHFVATMTFKTFEQQDTTFKMLDAMITAGFLPAGTTVSARLGDLGRFNLALRSSRGVLGNGEGVRRDTLHFVCTTEKKASALFTMLYSLSTAGLLPNARISHRMGNGKCVSFDVESDAVIKNRKAFERRQARRLALSSKGGAK